MKLCQKCKLPFGKQIIDGRVRKPQHRKFCWTCSPFDRGNNRDLTRTMKTCSRCKRKISLEVFREAFCDECMAQYQFERLWQIKEEAIKYKGGKCCICGYFKYIGSLDFHHRTPAEKDYNIAHTGSQLEIIKPELDKCDLLCANCHRKLHFLADFDLRYKPSPLLTDIFSGRFVSSFVDSAPDGYKTCRDCMLVLPINQFSLRTVCCKQCIKKQTGYWRLQTKLAAMNYMGNKCSACGEQPHPAYCEFHHRDPAKKDFVISAKLHPLKKNFLSKIIIAELDKCDLFCTNCHRELHGSLAGHPFRSSDSDYSSEDFLPKMILTNLRRGYNHRIEYRGREFNLSELSRETGVGFSILWHRIVRAGWDTEKATSVPVRKYSK